MRRYPLEVEMNALVRVQPHRLRVQDSVRHNRQQEDDDRFSQTKRRAAA